MSGSVAVVLVVAVVAMAYGTAAPQLGIAEFAPAARSQIAPPPTTAAGATSAGGGRARRAPTTTAPLASATTALAPADIGAASTTRVTRSRNCFGNPPRQTEDPMAPVCLATIFEGDNGGATSRGVSATEVRVAVVLPLSGALDKPTVDALFEHFNQRFELYGRRLVPVYFTGSAANPVAARAMVATMVEQGIFAAMIGALEVLDPHPALAAELARQGVVTIVRGAAMGWSDRTLYDELHPYVWSVYPSVEDTQANQAELACSALTGKPARFSIDPALQAKYRRFGVVAGATTTPPQVNRLVQRLTDCSGEAPQRVDLASYGAEVRTGMERMKAAGVTTMLCVCADEFVPISMREAHAVGFYPEWVINPVTWFGCESDCWFQFVRSVWKASPPVMLNAGPRSLPMQARPWFGPLQPVLGRPGASATNVLGLADLVYPQLLLFASGVQGAGPVLEPDTFAQSLMTIEFPNPGAGRPPYWQAGVGFGPGDHSFYDDYSVAWWSDDADAFEMLQGAKPKGSWCYVDQAARFTAGRYSTDLEAKLFNPAVPCR